MISNRVKHMATLFCRHQSFSLSRAVLVFWAGPCSITCYCCILALAVA